MAEYLREEIASKLWHALAVVNTTTTNADHVESIIHVCWWGVMDYPSMQVVQ